MIAWLAFALPVLTAAALIAILGLPVAFALRLRGFALVLVAIPAAFASLALSSIAAAIIGVPWSIAPPLAFSLLLAAILFALRRWISPAPIDASAEATRGSRMRSILVPVGAAAIGGAVIALSLVTGIRAPDAISQTFDAGFHLNAVRYILDTGSASPFTMDMSTPGSSVFYPTLWHGFVALVVQLAGATIPVATNAALFVVTAVVWPIGAVALGRAIAGPSTRVAVVSGTLAAAFPNFPLFLSGYGILYPNVLALTLMPYVLVAGLRLLNLGQAQRAIPMPAVAGWLFFVGALGGAVIAHPNVIHAILVWAAFPVLAAAIRAFRGGRVLNRAGFLSPSRTPLLLRRVLAVAGLAIYAVAVLGAWVFGRTGDDAWQGAFGPVGVILQIIDSTPNLKGSAWGVSVLVVLGALLVWRTPRLRWAVGSAAALAFLYFAADGFANPEWRSLILNPWYNDPRRLAALIPFGALPLAVLGASAGWAMLRPGLRRFAGIRSAKPRQAAAVLTASAVILLLAIGQAGVHTARQKLRDSYDASRAVLLSADERALIDRLDESVPEGERLVNNPLNGSALGFALADREVLFPHAGGAYDPRYYELVASLVKQPAEACDIASAIDVEYVLDFGQDYIFENDPNRERPFVKMKRLDRSPILTEIDSEGDARLFQITGC